MIVKINIGTDVNVWPLKINNRSRNYILKGFEGLLGKPMGVVFFC